MSMQKLSTATIGNRTFRWLLAACIVTSAIVVAVGLTKPAPATAAEATTKIVNGDFVGSAEYGDRWESIVALAYTDAPLPAGHFCGGTLINSRLVLTAAHCVADEIGDPGYIGAVIGRPKLDNLVMGERIAAEAIFVHPDYDSDTLENDIAIVRLESASAAAVMQVVQAGSEALWGNGAGLAAVDDENNLTDGPFVGGWGDHYFPTSWFTSDLYEVAIPITSDADCLTNLDDPFVSSVMLCAGVLDTDVAEETSNGKDSCYGDSGGPLIVNDTVEGTGTYYVAGLVSFGLSGCGSDLYGIYTRVDTFRDWVESFDNATGGAGGILDPEEVQMTAASYHAITLSWVAPSLGPVPTTYRVYGGEDGPVDTALTELEIDGLLVNNSYEFYICSLDADGNESPCIQPAISADTRYDGTRPSTPQNLRKLARTSSSVRLAWNASTDNDSVRRYQLQKRLGTGSWITVSSSITTLNRNVTGLRRGRSYSFRVRAFDYAGNVSNWSSTKTYSTL